MDFVWVVTQIQDTSNQWNESEITKIIAIFSSEDKANEWIMKAEGRSNFGRINGSDKRWFEIAKAPLNVVKPLTDDDDDE